MIRKLSRIFILQLVWVLSLVLPVPAEAGEAILFEGNAPTLKEQISEDPPIFADEKVLEFKLTLDYEALLKDRGEERGYHQALLTYKDSTGAPVDVNLKVMVRGKRRRDPSVCGFPPLLLNISRKTSQHTIFRKVNKIKLVTHCLNEDYVVREYLVYKLYNVLTDRSFRVRLCRIDYVDINGKKKPEQKYAFMIEDDDEMARRHKGKVLPEKLIITMDKTEERSMALMAFFQYLIGNTDWSVPYRHNIDLVSTDSLAAPFPVPFDFDYSGIVGTPYAVPPPELGISSVRQRLFRGYAYSENTYRETVNTFNARRTAIYAVYRQCDLLDRGYLKRTLKYLDGFYKTINDPKDFQNRIVKVAQRNQRNYVVVRGLE
ncbi:hypothetical protein [Pontibacter ruber]|uniref:YARHG domain-containing protein n=1 Tax=Pontibacter ruber TaxID=1343895 RepID=A0ABW5CX69_9BACT|nr:hypothetical protein [Pontibacter ruber]